MARFDDGKPERCEETEMSAILSPGRFFGAVEGRHATGPFALIETRHVRGEQIPVHRHDRPYFCLVVRGGYHERAGSTEVICRQNTVVFHPRGVTHEDRFGDAGGRCFNLECESSWLGDRDSGLENLVAPLYLRDDHAAWLTHRLHHEARALDAHSDLAIDGLARALVASVARCAASARVSANAPTGPEWFREAVAIAHTEYADRVGLADLSGRVGIHPRHLARTFRDRMGCTLGEFVRSRRIEVACRLLRASEDSISSIAFRTGFADQSHMTRTFKRNVGTTPSAYRRQTRRRPSRPDSSH